MRERSMESGSVLVFALVFLLVVSLMALTGLENALLESRMVTAISIREKVLSHAELGLKLAESAIVTEINNGQSLEIRDEDHFYPLTGTGAIDPSSEDWSAIPFRGKDDSRGIEYVIEYAGPVSVASGETAGESRVMGSQEPGDAGMAHLFVISSRAELNGVVRLVQSVYASAKAP